MKTIIKRSIFLLVMFISLAFVIPCNNVFAKEATEDLIIVYKRTELNLDDENNQIYTYNIEGTEGSKYIDFPNQIENLTVSYDESEDTIYIDIKKDKTVTLQAYFDESLRSIIACSRDLVIRGEGKLYLYFLANPIYSEDDTQIADYEYNAIHVIGDFVAGEENKKGPTIKIDEKIKETNSEQYKHLNGIEANKFYFYNSKVSINTKTTSLLCSCEPLDAAFNSTVNNDRVCIYNSNVNFQYEPLSMQGYIMQREFHVFKFTKSESFGNFVAEKSDVKIVCKDYKGYDSVIDPSTAIELPKESHVSFIDSSLYLRSNTNLILFSAEEVSFENCDNIDCVQETFEHIDYPMFVTNKFIIKNSNFNIKSCVPIVSARNKITHQEKLSNNLLNDDVKPYYIEIIEDDSHSGKMYVDSPDTCYVFANPTDINTFTFGPFDANVYLEAPKTSSFKISKLGKPNLSICSMNDFIEGDARYFVYDHDDLSFNDLETITWNYLEIKAPNNDSNEIRHEVLNTGTN